MCSKCNEHTTPTHFQTYNLLPVCTLKVAAAVYTISYNQVRNSLKQ